MLKNQDSQPQENADFALTKPAAAQEDLGKRLARHGLLFFIIISVVIHLSGLSPVIIEQLIPEEEPVLISAEELAAEAAALAKQEQLELIELKKQSLREQMKQSFDAIAEDVEADVVKDVWEDVEEQLQEKFSDLEAVMSQEDYDLETFSDDYMELSADMFEETADIMKEMLREELLSAMLAQVHDHTAKKLAQDLDKRFEERQGAREEKRLTDAAKRDTKRRRDEVKKQTEKLKKQAEQIVKEQEALAALEKNPEQKKSDLVKKQQQVQKKTQTLSKDLAALKKEIAEIVPDVGERHQEQLQSKKLDTAGEQQEQAQQELSKNQDAQQEMQEALQALKESSAELAELSKDMHKGEEIDEIAREAMKKVIEAQLKKSIEEKFDKELTEQLVPKSTEQVIKQAKKYLDDFKMDKDEELLAQLKEEVSAALAEQVPKEMTDEAEDSAMKKAEEKHKLAAVEAGAESLALTESAKNIAKDIARAEKNRAKETRAEVDQAARKTELGDMSEAMAALKSKMDMLSKAESMAKQIRDGRGDMGELGEMLSMMEMMEDGSGSGSMPPGMSLPFSRPGPGKGGPFNAKTYQQMLDMSKARQNPDAAYEDIQREADKLVSTASDFPSKRSAIIVDTNPASDEQAVQEEQARVLAEPSFKPIQYGFATMRKEEVVLDADLSEWDLSRKQYTRILQTSPEPTYWSDAEAMPLYMMWDHKGYYIAAVVRNDEINVVPNAGQFWVGDCIEIWMDTSNKRGPLMSYLEAAQMWLFPNGNKANPEIIGGIGHGRLKGHGMRFKKDDPGIQYASKNIAGGYQIEIFIPQSILHGPKFEAGKYLGFQIAFNSVAKTTGAAWALRVHHSWERPDTWGDVLLLGSDADLSFCKDDAGEEALTVLVPGESMRVKIHDPDMNLSPRFKDQIFCQAIGALGHGQMLVLGETEPDSGIFIGALETHSAYIGLQDGSLPVEPGQRVKVVYLDQRRDYGEANKRIEKELMASWPTLRLGKH